MVVPTCAQCHHILRTVKYFQFERYFCSQKCLYQFEDSLETEIAVKFVAWIKSQRKELDMNPVSITPHHKHD